MILRKLFTAVRGAATEAGETVMDHQALRILDQEIREAAEALARSKGDLTELIAQRRLTEGRRGDLDRRIAEFEEHAAKALGQGREDLAIEVAERISELEAQRAEAEQGSAFFAQNEGGLRETIRKTEASLRRLKAQVDTVKATASVQRAQSSIASRHAGAQSRMGDAVGSLERIKQRQIVQAERFKAADELTREETGADLDAKLAAAGITQGNAGAQAVLERLRARQLTGPA